MYTRDVMPNLQHWLKSQDLGFLDIVAQFWSLELNAPDLRTALPVLIQVMLNPALVLEIAESLPDEPRQALDALIAHSGWMLWSRFVRRYGELREVGPGKRDREKPFLEPVSPAEMLWYRGLIGRDFLKRDGELRECAYIPDDLLGLLPAVVLPEPQPLGRAASPGETVRISLVSDRILDHACTLLAALRLEDPQRSPAIADWQPPFQVVHALLGAMKLITSSEQPVPEDARPFLEMPRGQALAWLVRGWRESTFFNELRLLPSVTCEGAWRNDPKTAREYVFERLSELPAGKWWHLDSFIKAIYDHAPDFQRPAGDFDSWLIRDTDEGNTLMGIKHWDEVDGALVRYLITGPMHWLGLIDLASPADLAQITAFRLSDWSTPLLLGKPYPNAVDEDHPIESFSDGTLTASRYTPRLARYQVSRFCDWIEESATKYTYHLSPSSLKTAAQQGLKISHLETLFNKYGQAPPPSLIQALHQWEKSGQQAQIQPCVILRVESPQILKILRESPAGRFVGNPLGPTAAILHPGAIEKVSEALARLGYLCDIETLVETPELPDQLEL